MTLDYMPPNGKRRLVDCGTASWLLALNCRPHCRCTDPAAFHPKKTAVVSDSFRLISESAFSSIQNTKLWYGSSLLPLTFVWLFCLCSMEHTFAAMNPTYFLYCHGCLHNGYGGFVLYLVALDFPLMVDVET